MKKPIKKITFRHACHPERSEGPNVPQVPAVLSSSLDDWVDSQIVMHLLHISPRTLHTLRTNGTLPYSRIGYKFYYRKQDIQKILSDNYTMYKIHTHENK
jgi:hypothetical protein